MIWFPVLIAVGVGGIVLGGCGKDLDESEEKSKENAIGNSGASTFQKVVPPQADINVPQSMPVPQIVRPDTVNVGAVKSSERDPGAWAARQGVMNHFVVRYQNLLSSGYFPASDSESRKKAILFMLDSIYTVYMKPGRQPFMVSYTNYEKNLVIHKVENPAQIFRELLEDIDPSTKGDFEKISREGSEKTAPPLAPAVSTGSSSNGKEKKAKSTKSAKQTDPFGL